MKKILVTMMVAILSLGSLVSAYAMTDDEVAAKIVGEWYARDKTGNTVYMFNEDGTWTESGIYYFKDGPKEIELEGHWYVQDSFFYHSVEKCNLPAKIKTGKFNKIRIKRVTSDEFYMLLSPGKLTPHLSLK